MKNCCEMSQVRHRGERAVRSVGGSSSVILEIARSCNTGSPRGAVGASPFRFPTSNQNVPSRMNTLTFSANVVLWSQKFDKFFDITGDNSILDIKRHVEYTSIIRSGGSLTNWQDLPRTMRSPSDGLHQRDCVDQCGDRHKGKGLLGGL